MTPIVFRHLPAVAELEDQLRLQSLGVLADDEAEELLHLIDDASRELFGITANDTFYPALPESVRAQFSRVEWERHFDLLGHFTRDPNAHWHRFGLDLRCPEGGRLHCLEVFGRQLVVALNGLHPRAMLAFAQETHAEAA